MGNLGIGAYFGAECAKHGMLVRVAGDTIMMSPPFIINPQEVDEVHFSAFLLPVKNKRLYKLLLLIFLVKFEVIN